MELKEPKRKRSANIPQSQSLPVLIGSVSGIATCKSLWPLYTGTFSGDFVIVSGKDDMTSLYNMGFFGKGCLSRGFPNFGKAKRGVPVLVTKRQWKRRKLWIDNLLSVTNSTDFENNERHSNSNKYSNTLDNDAVATNVDSNAIDFTNSINTEMKATNKNLSRDSSGQRRHSTCSKNNLQVGAISNSSKSAIDISSRSSESCASNCNDSSAISEDDSSCSFMSRPQDGMFNRNVNDCVIVINNISSDDESHSESLHPHLCKEPIKTAVETLNLTLEEAFFLSFGLGCLQVVDLQGVFISLESMWHLYKEVQSNFIPSYITYHYFRSKGWIVKPGTKFGGDFLLYKEGPPFYHASYVVVIEEANNKFGNQNVKRQLTWTKIMGLNRIAETAGKEVLLSQVVWPSTIELEDLDNPRIISKFKVQEILLRRWNSGLEREIKET